MKKNKNILLGFDLYELDPLSKIISFTQKNKRKIKKEFSKLKKFYEDNPDAFYLLLEEKRRLIEEKDSLSEYDQKTLSDIEVFFKEEKKVGDFFYFRNEFLLDSFQKIFQQLKKVKISKFVPTIDVLFYSLAPLSLNEQNKDISIGEYYSDGSLNTGSKLQLEVVRMDLNFFLENYNALLN